MSDAIVVQNVSKHFVRRNARPTSLKEFLVHGWRRKEGQSPANTLAAVDNISFNVPRGQAVGLIGRNGSGKSSLFKLLLGIYRPTSGHVELHGRAAAVIELTAGFHPELSGLENIYLNGAFYGLHRRDIDAHLEAILEFADIGDYLYEPVRTYSSGMKARLAFSLAIHVQADVLLFDEVLAVGDAGFAQKCLEYFEQLKADGKTLVIVSHNMEHIQRICDRTLWLDKGRLLIDGRTPEVISKYLSTVTRRSA